MNPDPTSDIDMLLKYLSSAAEDPHTKTPIGITAAGFYAALTALVADRNALRIELERERMRLSACGVVAISNTRQTAEENRQVSDEYKSASFDEVCAAVDREMALRERVAELGTSVSNLAILNGQLLEQPPADRDRDLRERLVCAAIAGLMAFPDNNERTLDEWAAVAVMQADATLAAMRKGESDGK